MVRGWIPEWEGFRLLFGCLTGGFGVELPSKSEAAPCKADHESLKKSLIVAGEACLAALSEPPLDALVVWSWSFCAPLRGLVRGRCREGRGEESLDSKGDGTGEAMRMLGAVEGLYVDSSPSSRPEMSLAILGLSEEAVAGVELVLEALPPLLEFMAGSAEMS